MDIIERPHQVRRGDLYRTTRAAPVDAGDDRRFRDILDDAVLERAWLWRAITARAAELAPDVVAERHLERWVSDRNTRTATATLWYTKLDSGIARLVAARAPVPRDAEAAADALGRASDMDPAELVSVFVGAAATVAATIPRVERVAETPAMVAARMVCFAPTYRNLDTFATAILDSVTDTRYDLAVALLAGVIHGLPTTDAHLGALGPYLRTLTTQHPLPAVPASRQLRAGSSDPCLDADVGALVSLAAGAVHLNGFAAVHGWDRAVRACAALIVETALVTTGAEHRTATAVLADLLARWTLFEQDIPGVLGILARARSRDALTAGREDASYGSSSA
ncbi:MAG TPA: hypothetical protein VFV63_10250 [Ilumatobacteraceae bacterium]|nr:hypothetical protein [Ilumatobacteraceae bacterium]